MVLAWGEKLRLRISLIHFFSKNCLHKSTIHDGIVNSEPSIKCWSLSKISKSYEQSTAISNSFP